jgi:hypothetical protein
MVLPFRQSFVSLALLPETSSRVTLALLGSVFQTKKDRNISYKIGQDLIIVLVYSSHCRGEGHLTTLYYIAKFLKRRMHSPSHYELRISIHARPCVSTRGRVNQMCGFPQIIMNYELRIMNYSSFPSFTYSIARLI